MRAPLEELCDVVVGHEALGMRPGEHHAADPVVGVDSRQEVIERVDGSCVHQRVRPVLERGEQDPSALLYVDGSHARHPMRSRLRWPRSGASTPRRSPTESRATVGRDLGPSGRDAMMQG